jgi:hypothetical protein
MDLEAGLANSYLKTDQKICFIYNINGLPDIYLGGRLWINFTYIIFLHLQFINVEEFETH